MIKPPRIIKKYPNRRLYDTEKSAYITLPAVKQMVIGREAFRVVDTKTQADRTREILLQVIFEEEMSATPIFTNALLAQMIRSYGGSMQGMMGACLERSIQSFSEAQQQMQTQLRERYADSLAAGGKRWAQLLAG